MVWVYYIDSVDSILARFADTGFSPAEVVALLASYVIINLKFGARNTDFNVTQALCCGSGPRRPHHSRNAIRLHPVALRFPGLR